MIDYGDVLYDEYFDKTLFLNYKFTLSTDQIKIISRPDNKSTKPT